MCLKTRTVSKVLCWCSRRTDRRSVTGGVCPGESAMHIGEAEGATARGLCSPFEESEFFLNAVEYADESEQWRDMARSYKGHRAENE